MQPRWLLVGVAGLIRVARHFVAAVIAVVVFAASAAAALRIEGVDDTTEEILRAYLTVGDLPCDSPRWWVARAFQGAAGEVRLALETMGYYRAEIDTALDWDAHCWQIRVSVARGEGARFGAVRVEVAGALGEEPALRDLLAERPLRRGRRFTHQTYESLKTRLLEVAEDHGYFDARFTTAAVRVDLDTNRADVELVLEGGERYRIGAIETDQDLLRPELFRRFLRIEAGQPFDAQDLVATHRDLLTSQYFDRVLVTPDLDARADHQVPIRVAASADTQRSILLGAGYTTDVGPRARADLRYRRLNDRGHRAHFTNRAAESLGEIRADYRLPYGDPAHEWLFAETSYVYEQTGSYDSRRWSIGGGRTLLRGGRGRHWTETNYFDHQIDDFEVGGQDGRSRLLLLGSNWIRKTLTDEPRPVAGYLLSLDVRGAAGLLLSDTDVLQVMVRGRHIQGLGGRLRALSRAALGWTWQNAFDDLPPSIRFFAGGDNSVRGYGFESLGPKTDGAVVGGRKLLTGSIELDYLVRPNWSLALFADVGSAFDDSVDFSRGAGLGLRWFSPLGPLRFDLAHPLDDPGRAVRIHISLGPDL
jgi:translocation and assembly module TamA